MSITASQAHSYETSTGGEIISTDPAYAPQILNPVSLWGDIYDSWVRKLHLIPGLYSGGAFDSSYERSFEDEVSAPPRPPFGKTAAVARSNTKLRHDPIVDCPRMLDAKDFVEFHATWNGWKRQRS